MNLFGKNKVRVRFAPSPTGEMHLGSLRIALNNFLFARHHGGEFLLRIEDTDQARFVPGAIKNIIDTLTWAGMDYDEGPILSGDVVTDKGKHGPYLQSRRLDIYRRYSDELVHKGHAYPCFCTAERLEQMRREQELRKEPPRYDGRCRNLSADEIAKNRAAKMPEVVRLKMPKEGVSAFDDLVRGRISFENKLIDDQVLMKSDGFPTYHLAVVVDDHEMGITHVIRGEEWISSTPKHLFLYSCFGWKPPEFAHMPLILKPGGGKLSKRDLASSAMGYVDLGYTKEALLNFVALLGWHPKGDKERMTMEEMIAEFDLAQVGSAGAIFTTDKLDWLNGVFIRSLGAEDFARQSRPYLEKSGLIGPDFPEEKLVKYLALEQSRIRRFTELPEAVSYLFKAPRPEKQALSWKTQTAESAAERLESLLAFFSGLEEERFEAKKLEESTKAAIAASGTSNGENLWPLRVALSGRESSPGPFEIAAVLGKGETLSRIKSAIEILKS